MKNWVAEGIASDVNDFIPLIILSCPYGPKLKIHVGNWTEALSVISNL